MLVFIQIGYKLTFVDSMVLLFYFLCIPVNVVIFTLHIFSLFKYQQKVCNVKITTCIYIAGYYDVWQ